MPRERRWRIGRWHHPDAIMPPGRQAYPRCAKQIVRRSRDKQAAIRRHADLPQGKLIGLRLRLVEAGALCGDDHTEWDDKATSSASPKYLGAVGYHPERHPRIVEFGKNAIRLGPWLKGVVAGGKLGGEAEMFLFGAVLDAFFSSYASLNSLHQFAIKGLEGKAVFDWPMRAGMGVTS